MSRGNIPRIPMQVSRDCVIASIQVDLSDDVLRQFRVDLLDIISKSDVVGVILDVSGVEIMDVEDFQSLHRIMRMATLLGAVPVVAGLRPGVVSSLIELGVNTQGFEAALNMDEAFRLMEQLRDNESGKVRSREIGDDADRPPSYF